jgi:hypothetical protein
MLSMIWWYLQGVICSNNSSLLFGKMGYSRFDIMSGCRSLCSSLQQGSPPPKLGGSLHAVNELVVHAPLDPQHHQQ